MKLFSKEKQGFTLIELLVVVAIIGILAAMVLVSMSGAQDRAKDGRMISDMNQIRATAEIISGNEGSYAKVAFQSADINSLNNDIAAMGGKEVDGVTSGVDIFVNATTDAYCAAVVLKSGKAWCVDSTLISKQYASNSVLTLNCDQHNARCEP